MRQVKAGRPVEIVLPHRGPHRFGAHLSIAGGMHKALERAFELGCDAVQVFVKNQRQWRAAALRPDDLGRWFELLDRPGFGPVVAHAGYLINLASPDRRLLARSRAALVEEIKRCEMLGIPYLVIHPGSAGASQPRLAIARIARTLNAVFERATTARTRVLLETTAGQGTSIGRTFGEIGEIIGLIGEPARVGVCVDTCHVFAAGYELRQALAYEALVAEIERTVGRERVCCWHLNDSLAECGSHRDRHAHIGQGRIGAAGFRNLLADARFHGVPMILETPKGTDSAGRDWDAVNLRRLRVLAAGRRAIRDGLCRT